MGYPFLHRFLDICRMNQCLDAIDNVVEEAVVDIVVRPKIGLETVLWEFLLNEFVLVLGYRVARQLPVRVPVVEEHQRGSQPATSIKDLELSMLQRSNVLGYRTVNQFVVFLCGSYRLSAYEKTSGISA